MPATWAVWGRDLTGDGRADPFNPREAIDAQGRLMCHLYSLAQESGLDDDPGGSCTGGLQRRLGPGESVRGVPPYPETKEYVRTIRKSRECSIPLEGCLLTASSVRYHRATTQGGCP